MKPFAASLFSVFLLAAAAQAETTATYTVSFQGKVAGKQTVTTIEGGRIAVDYSFSNNGRGPHLHEEMTIDPTRRLAWSQVMFRRHCAASG